VIETVPPRAERKESPQGAQIPTTWLNEKRPEKKKKDQEKQKKGKGSPPTWAKAHPKKKAEGNKKKEKKPVPHGRFLLAARRWKEGQRKEERGEKNTRAMPNALDLP